MNLFRFFAQKKADGMACTSDALFPARYDFWRGDLDLVNVKENDTDRDLGLFFDKFAKSSPRERARIRKLNGEQITELRWYPLRAAVLALKSRESRWVASGFAAIAAADPEKFPPGWSTGALAFLFHAGVRIAPNEVSAQFTATTGMADARTSAFMSKFMQLTPEAKEACFAAYETEVQTEDGIGFLMAGGESYKPTYDLAQLIVRLRKLISSDQYEPQLVSLGGSLPDFSFRKYSHGSEPVAQFERGTDLADALDGIRGTAAIVASLRPSHSSNYQAYSLVAHISECAEVVSREFLCCRLDQNPTLGAVVHVSEGPLLCDIQGIGPSPAYESDDKLKRFAGPIVEILRSARSIESK